MLFFKTDVKGQVKNTELPRSNGIWALYEAIINSIQALEDYPLADGLIEIVAKRDNVDTTSGQLQGQIGLDEQKTLMPYETFEITDNGCGFNGINYDSFLTSHSTLKIEKGCKGIGRFLWLKAFNKVSVKSNYQEDDTWICRQFDFDENGISPDLVNNFTTSDIQERKTTVALQGFQKTYQVGVPKRLESLASKIVEHCLTYFVLDKCPRIKLHDDLDSLWLHDYYNTHIRDSLQRDNFELSERNFTIYHLHMQKNVDTHRLHLCANDREVRSVTLTKSIPNLNKKIRSVTGEEFFYTGYMTGDYLDGIVDNSRTRLNFPQDDAQLEVSENETPVEPVSEDTLIEKAKTYVLAHLKDYIDEIDKIKREQINRLISKKYPKYRFLLNMRPETFDYIKAGLTDDELEIALHRELLKWEEDTITKGETVRKEVARKGADPASIMPLFEKYYSNVAELNKVSLSEYVTRRKVILELLSNALQMRDDGKYENEDMIHSIICPMKITSNEISIEEMNLWIIDERLTYHSYLASDKQTREIPFIETQSQSRMDIAVFDIYDEAFSFSTGDRNIDSIAIIEFKKPDRNNYNQNYNPIDQVLDYVEELKAGRAKTAKGIKIDNVVNTAFYCYVIADFTETLEKTARRRGLTVSSDSNRYFGYVKDPGTYMEVISYKKLLYDAEDRNRILFDKLFSPRPTDIIHRIPADNKSE